VIYGHSVELCFQIGSLLLFMFVQPLTNQCLHRSPLMDLLDSGNFTLEDLLREDELIQEVKAKNDRLIEL
jgi:hypothetical protein